MIEALAARRPPQVWLLTALAAAVTAMWLATKPATEAANALPWILCSTPIGQSEGPRPRTAVKTLQSEALVAARGKHVLVQLPPLAFSPRRVHGGDVTAYVLSGTVRSEHGGLPAVGICSTSRTERATYSSRIRVRRKPPTCWPSPSTKKAHPSPLSSIDDH